MDKASVRRIAATLRGEGGSAQWTLPTQASAMFVVALVKEEVPTARCAVDRRPGEEGTFDFVVRAYVP